MRLAASIAALRDTTGNGRSLVHVNKEMALMRSQHHRPVTYRRNLLDKSPPRRDALSPWVSRAATPPSRDLGSAGDEGDVWRTMLPAGPLRSFHDPSKVTYSTYQYWPIATRITCVYMRWLAFKGPLDHMWSSGPCGRKTGSRNYPPRQSHLWKPEQLPLT